MVKSTTTGHCDPNSRLRDAFFGPIPIQRSSFICTPRWGKRCSTVSGGCSRSLSGTWINARCCLRATLTGSSRSIILMSPELCDLHRKLKRCLQDVEFRARPNLQAGSVFFSLAAFRNLLRFTAISAPCQPALPCGLTRLELVKREGIFLFQRHSGEQKSEARFWKQPKSRNVCGPG